MPFYGHKFFSSMSGHSGNVVAAYLRLIWLYWSHFDCKGLPNDSEYLRRSAGIDPDDWKAVWDVLFSENEFFILDAQGLWQQSFAQLVYSESEKKYQAASEHGRKGAMKMWEKRKARASGQAMPE
jgi:uncharacterized protein YdaU (DUF1376 family)